MSIAKRWKVLHGSNNWQGLIKPLDRDLQKVLLHYGGYSTATYNAFNYLTALSGGGDSRYRPNNILQRTGLLRGNKIKYECTKFIYAATSGSSRGGGTPSSFVQPSTSPNARVRGCNWMGFVAVSTNEGTQALGRRDIIVAWRGTLKLDEWMKDFDVGLTSANRILGRSARPARVHRGFVTLYTNVNPLSSHNRTASARDIALGEVKRQLERFPREEVSITVVGHSLGAALSTLNAVDLVTSGTCKGRMVTAFNQGNPRVGDRNFKSVVDSLAREGLHIFRTVNRPDIITQVPPMGLFAHVGQELVIDSRGSSALRRAMPGGMVPYHLPEPGYMHPLSRMNGRVLRDIALVNTSSDSLKPEYLVPPSWWTERNKGMVQQSDGTWQWKDENDERSNDMLQQSDGTWQGKDENDENKDMLQQSDGTWKGKDPEDDDENY